MNYNYIYIIYLLLDFVYLKLKICKFVVIIVIFDALHFLYY